MKYRGKIYVEGIVEDKNNTTKTKGYGEFEASHKDIGMTLSSATSDGIDSAIRYASDIYKWKHSEK